MIINDKSSKYNFKIMEKCKNLILENNMKVKTLHTSKNKNIFIEDFENKLIQSSKHSDAVICYGGDGIYGLICNTLNKNEQTAPIGFVSIGTANDMATNLGLEKDPIECTNQILNGIIKKQDIITVNNEGFGYVSAFGPITNTTYNTNPQMKKKLGKLSYILNAKNEIIKVIKKKYEPYKITYLANNKLKNTECLIGLITNAKKFSGIKLYDNIKLNDGKFEMLLIKPNIIDIAPKVIKDFLKSYYKEANINIIQKYPDIFESISTNDLKIAFENPPKAPLNNDGDAGITLSSKNNILHYQTKKKIKLLLPKNNG